MSRDWRLYWRDIIVCCQKVQTYVGTMDLAAFKADERSYDAVVRNLELIGEAAKALTPDARALAPEIEWRKIAGMRDVLAHGYFGIKDEFLWDVITTKVPELLAAMEHVNIQGRDGRQGRRRVQHSGHGVSVVGWRYEHSDPSPHDRRRVPRLG